MKIDIISGFLGAGKTTFIKRILKTRLTNEKVVLIENEFGEISVDSAFLQDAKVDIKEISQGCICCSLVGDFEKSLNEVVNTYKPDRVIIEPSGVGKLSDVKAAVMKAGLGEFLNSYICLVDAQRAKMYLRNFGEFFKDQIESASTIVLSRTDVARADQIEVAMEIVRQLNATANVITTPINDLDDETLISSYEGVDKNELAKLIEEALEEASDEECDDPECECHHHHHHHEEEECDDPECECHHHHHHDDDDEDEEEHEHHHHHHHHDEEECDDPECECHHHHHHDDEDEHEHHHHHHHHGHHADEVFQTVGIETTKVYDIVNFTEILNRLANTMDYGIIVRAKGVINTNQGWKEFNLSPNEVLVNDGNKPIIGMIVVIGSNIDASEIKNLF